LVFTNVEGFLDNLLYPDSRFQLSFSCYPLTVKAFVGLSESYGCGVDIVGGWGIAKEGGADPVVRNESRDSLAASVVFRSITCPLLYTVTVCYSRSCTGKENQCFDVLPVLKH